MISKVYKGQTIKGKIQPKDTITGEPSSITTTGVISVNGESGIVELDSSKIPYLVEDTNVQDKLVDLQNQIDQTIPTSDLRTINGEPLYNDDVHNQDIGAVRFDEELELTDAQKETARTNIGAGDYNKPEDGIPESDLDSELQDAIEKAKISITEQNIYDYKLVRYIGTSTIDPLYKKGPMVDDNWVDKKEGFIVDYYREDEYSQLIREFWIFKDSSWQLIRRLNDQDISTEANITQGKINGLRSDYSINSSQTANNRGYLDEIDNLISDDQTVGSIDYRIREKVESLDYNEVIFPANTHGLQDNTIASIKEEDGKISVTARTLDRNDFLEDDAFTEQQIEGLPEDLARITYETRWEIGSGENSVQTKDTGAQANGKMSVAQGLNTVAGSDYSHVEGYASKTVVDPDDSDGHGSASHAEGTGTVAKGTSSHAEGGGTLARGRDSHAEGNSTATMGDASHTEGNWTITNNLAEHAEGTFNLSNMSSSTFGDAGNTLHSIGIGRATGELKDDRKNAFEIMQNGDTYIIGLGEYNGKNINSADTVQDVVNTEIETRISNDQILNTKSVSTDGLMLTMKTIDSEGQQGEDLTFQPVLPVEKEYLEDQVFNQYFTVTIGGGSTSSNVFNVQFPHTFTLTAKYGNDNVDLYQVPSGWTRTGVGTYTISKNFDITSDSAISVTSGAPVCYYKNQENRKKTAASQTYSATKPGYIFTSDLDSVTSAQITNLINQSNTVKISNGGSPAGDKSISGTENKYVYYLVPQYRQITVKQLGVSIVEAKVTVNDIIVHNSDSGNIDKNIGDYYYYRTSQLIGTKSLTATIANG